MKNLMVEFRAFLMRGNLVELAVAFVLGAAFAALVTAFEKDLITPIIAAIFGSHDFSGLDLTINGSTFFYGDFINALITFVSVAAAIFFFVVKPMNVVEARRKKAPEPDDPLRACPECLSDIPRDARRCAFCATVVGPVGI